MPESACVSTSSVKKTLRHTIQLDQRLSVLSHARVSCRPGRLRYVLRARSSAGLRLPYFSLMRSYASYADMSDRITWSPTLRPDSTSMVLTELRPSLTCTRSAFDAVRADLEQADGALVLAERRAPHEQHVVQPFELDRAVDAQVGHGALRQIAGQRHVHRARAVLHRRIDARDAAFDDAVARVDFGLLADLNVLGLRFRDLDFRLQPARIGDAGEVGARARPAGRLRPAPAAACRRGRRAPSARRAAAASAAATRAPDRPATAARPAARASIRPCSRAAPSRSGCARRADSASTCDCSQHQRRDQLILRERLVHLRLHLRLVVVGLDARRRGALLRAGRCCTCTRMLASAASARLQLQLRVLQLLFELRVASARG